MRVVGAVHWRRTGGTVQGMLRTLGPAHLSLILLWRDLTGRVIALLTRLLVPK